MRKDLKMRRGKEIAQGSHASIAFMTRRIQDMVPHWWMWHESGYVTFKDFELTEAEYEWIRSGFAKITLQVDSEAELFEIRDKALAAGLQAHLVIDSGKTEFNGVPTPTCLAIGPDRVDKIDPITRHLKLY
jgi:PTH2 family peptidyl-tRNA hydrolase